MSIENRAIRILWMLVAVLVGVFGSCQPELGKLAAEEPWEFSPYRVRAWVHMDDHPALNARLFEQFKYDVPYFGKLMDKSGWRISIEPAPVGYKHLIDRGVESIELTDEQKVQGDIRRGDRIAFVHISHTANEFSIQSRQFDCQTHLWGPTSTKKTIYPSRLPRLLFESIQETLVPIAKIEKIEGKYVRLRVRASQIMKKVENGVLVPNTNSPGWIDLSSTFLPVVRLNDKDGYIRLKDGIKVYDWTFLRPVEEVRSEHVEDESYIKAEIHGAKRAPLAGRTNRSQRKFALVVRPTLKETRLQLVTREKNPKPIPDKKIYLKYPGEKDSKVIGRTDRKGEIVIKSNDQPLHLIYIKSGERRILARLPIVPGYFANLNANMQDDKVRLRAEGVLAGLEFNFMDLTVRRQVLAVRIRNALIKKDHVEARRIYNDYYLGLSTADSFMIKVDNDKDRLTDELKEKNLDKIKMRDQEKQKKLITNMFKEFKKLVNAKADRGLDLALNKEIQTVENGGVYKPSGDNLDTSDIDKNLEEESGKSSGAGGPTP